MNYFSVLVRIFHAFIVQLFHFTKHYMNGDEVTPHDEVAPFDGSCTPDMSIIFLVIKNVVLAIFFKKLDENRNAGELRM